MPEIAVRNADSPTDLRGEETRRRLIEAAIQLFAVSGFDGVSTRALAQKAEVNLASIPYHFGSKKGLYRAAAEHIAGRCEEEIGPIVNQVERALENGRLSQREASRLLHQLLNSFARVVIGSREADSWSYFIVRE